MKKTFFIIMGMLYTLQIIYCLIKEYSLVYSLNNQDYRIEVYTDLRAEAYIPGFGLVFLIECFKAHNETIVLKRTPLRSGYWEMRIGGEPSNITDWSKVSLKIVKRPDLNGNMLILQQRDTSGNDEVLLEVSDYRLHHL